MSAHNRLPTIGLFFLVPALLSFAACGGAASAQPPPAEQITFSRDGALWIAGLTGGGQRKVAALSELGAASISPDGTEIVFHGGGAASETGFGTLYRVAAAGGEMQQLRVPGISRAQWPSYSSDGRRLVFVGLRDFAGGKATMSVTVLERETGNRRDIVLRKNVLLDAGYQFSAPVLSPDGSQVAWQHYGSDVSGGFEVSALNGNTIMNFPCSAQDPAPYWRPQFSPDGRSMLCYSPAVSEQTDDTIYLVELGRCAAKKLGRGTNPVFVKGGTAIVFERWTNHWSESAHSDLWIMETAAGSSPRLLIKNASQPGSRVLSAAAAPKYSLLFKRGNEWLLKRKDSERVLSGDIRLAALSPRARWIAVLRPGSVVDLLNGRTAERETSRSLEGECNSLAWSQSEQYLLAGCGRYALLLQEGAWSARKIYFASAEKAYWPIFAGKSTRIDYHTLDAFWHVFPENPADAAPVGIERVLGPGLMLTSADRIAPSPLSESDLAVTRPQHVFGRKPDTRHALLVYRSASGVAELGTSTESYFNPAWSPDGRWLYAEALGREGVTLKRFTISGGSETVGRAFERVSVALEE